AADPDLELVGIVVAAIALVAMDAAHCDTCELFEIGNRRTERVAVIGISVQGFGMQHELPAFGRGGWRSDRDLAAELVGGAGLAFAEDRKSTRLNSSHLGISYAVFCLKK